MGLLKSDPSLLNCYVSFISSSPPPGSIARQELHLTFQKHGGFGDKLAAVWFLLKIEDVVKAWVITIESLQSVALG